MKKLAIILFTLGFAVAAFAEDEKITQTNISNIPLKVGVSGIVYHTNYKTVKEDVSGDYTAARMRPMLNFTNGNIEATVLIEYDAVFGTQANNHDITPVTASQNATEKNTDKSSEYVGVGADKKGLEVAQAFIKTKVDAVTGLTLTGGIAAYDFPLIWGDNAPLASINYSNDLLDLGVYYVKPAEGVLNKGQDDSDLYIADAKIKFGESSVRPAFFMFKCQKNAVSGQYVDSKGYLGGLSANFAFGMFGIDAAGAYAKGSNKSKSTFNLTTNPYPYTVNYTGYAADIAPYIKIGDGIKVTVFGTIMSGDSNKDKTKKTSFFDATIDSGNAGMNSWRLFILEDGGSFTTFSDVADIGKYSDNSGIEAAGLAINATFGPVTAKLQGAYANAQKTVSAKHATTGLDTKIDKNKGIEVDANIGYALTKNSTLYVEGAFLKSGKFFSSSYDQSTDKISDVQRQNTHYVNVGVTYSL